MASQQDDTGGREQQMREDRRDRWEWLRHTTEQDDIPRDQTYDERPRLPRRPVRRPPGSF